jgi:hypothetical protein
MNYWPKCHKASLNSRRGFSLRKTLESRTMRHLLDSVRRSLSEKNWYAALAGALALPDIAGQLDCRPGGSKARFVSWFDDYMLSKYTITHGPAHIQQVFLSGNDCYALRCAYLHEGDFDITGQKVRDALARFHFTAPDHIVHQHCNYFHSPAGSWLQLDVSAFAEQVCQSVEEWLRIRGSDPSVSAAIARLPTIEIPPSSDQDSEFRRSMILAAKDAELPSTGSGTSTVGAIFTATPIL